MPYRPPFHLRLPSSRSMHARMLPSKPKAWPLWTTKSLKYGFSPFDVQRSLTLHPPEPCVTARRRMPTPASHRDRVDQDAAIRRHSRLNDRRPAFPLVFPQHFAVAGATLVAPEPLSSRTCVTPSIVARCGEL